MQGLEKEMEKAERESLKCRNKQKPKREKKQTKFETSLAQSHNDLASSTKDVFLKDQIMRPILQMHDLVSLTRKMAKNKSTLITNFRK